MLKQRKYWLWYNKTTNRIDEKKMYIKCNMECIIQGNNV